MKVTLVNRPTDEFVDMALGECWDKGCYAGEKRKKRIERNALKLKHGSVLEFMEFVFQIEASTKVLLEMTRHRHANYAVKSSRYTLNKGEIIVEPSDNPAIDAELHRLKNVIEMFVEDGISNDKVSLLLPQAYQYRWIAQFNARSLKNFLKLRTNKAAHFHIREVAQEMFTVVPQEYRYLFEEDIYGTAEDD